MELVLYYLYTDCELHPKVGNCLSDKVYHPKRTSLCYLCTVHCGGKRGSPPSVNTIQFSYRLLESQKVQNKRLKRLRNELNVLRCDAFTTSAEGTALTATS